MTRQVGGSRNEGMKEAAAVTATVNLVASSGVLFMVNRDETALLSSLQATNKLTCHPRILSCRS